MQKKGAPTAIGRLVRSITALLGSVGPAWAEAPRSWLDADNMQVVGSSFKALVVLFVLALLIESALTVIFSWRLYLSLFNGRGMKTLVMIAVSAFAVWLFQIDVVTTLMSAYGFTKSPSSDALFSQGLTALILAGGSAGVYRLLVSLGYRDRKAVEDIKPKPKDDKAWISVTVERDRAVGPVYVSVHDIGEAPPPNAAQDQTAPKSVAAVVFPVGIWRTIKSVFFLDQNRFPQAGGYDVDPKRVYAVAVIAHDENGKKLPSSIDGNYTFATKAIVDFNVKL